MSSSNSDQEFNVQPTPATAPGQVQSPAYEPNTMSHARRGSAFGWLSPVTLALRWASGIVVVALMLVTGFDVIMRYVLARPLDWSITVSMLGLVVIVVFAIPDIALRGDHIGMDLFYRNFGPRHTAIADAITALVTTVFCLVSAFAAGSVAITFMTAGLQTSGSFNIPIWWGYAILTIGMLLTAASVVVAYLSKRHTTAVQEVQPHV